MVVVEEEKGTSAASDTSAEETRAMRGWTDGRQWKSEQVMVSRRKNKEQGRHFHALPSEGGVHGLC